MRGLSRSVNPAIRRRELIRVRRSGSVLVGDPRQKIIEHVTFTIIAGGVLPCESTLQDVVDELTVVVILIHTGASLFET